MDYNVIYTVYKQRSSCL